MKLDPDGNVFPLTTDNPFIGVAVRDHIAICAMQGLLAGGMTGAVSVAAEAYRCADAMIKQSAKSAPGEATE